MQSEHSPDQPHQGNTPQPPNPASASQELQHPQQTPSRNPEEHLPISLCFHNVSAATLDLLLSTMLPEITPTIAECLRQTILNGATIPHDTLLESYFDLTPYAITHYRKFRLGRGPAEEIENRIVIERRSDEEPSVFELSLGNTNTRSVDLKVAYTWMSESERWDNVNEWGELLGIDSISSLFSNTPPELFENDRFGYCTSLVTGDISIVTEPVSSSRHTPFSNAPPTPHTTSHWIPIAVQLASPTYSEQAAILRTLSPHIGDSLLKESLHLTMDAFATQNAELKTRLLDRASSRLPCEVEIGFVRAVNLGPREDSYIDEDEKSEERCEGIGYPLPYGEEEEPTKDEHATKEDKIPFSADPIQDSRVSSGVNIDLFSSNLGTFRLEYLSTAQPHGLTILDGTQRFNFAEPVIGVRFFDDSPPLREVASRWRVLRQIALFGGVGIDRKNLEANLFLDAASPNGGPVSADIGVKRVLMAFHPPTDGRSDP